MKSVKIKLYLTYNQELIINTLSDEHRLLYNHLLEYTLANDIDFKELNERYRLYRHDNNLTINSKSAQNTCKSVINNIKSYLSLRKKDNKASPPNKFKSYKYFTSFTYDYNHGSGGFKLNDNLLTVHITTKYKLSLLLPSYSSNITNNNIKTITFKKEEDGNYYVILVYSETDSNIRDDNDRFMSIDLGLSDITTCYSNVIDSFSIQNKQHKPIEKQLKFIQSKLDNKIKYSNNYNRIKLRLNKVNKKLTNKNKDFQHKLSKNIIDICKSNEINTLIVGDIKTKKLVKDTKRIIDNETFLNKRKRIKQEKGLNKSTQGRGTLSRFKSYIEYKAINEGLIFKLRSEYNTSKINCLTDKIEFDSNLSNRIVEVAEGVFLNRDLNSAINIAKKYKVEWFNQFDIDTIKGIKYHKMLMDENSLMINIV